MPDGPRHEIVDVEVAEGELSFEARLNGAEPRRVFFRTDTSFTPNADAALASCLMPAMRSGGEMQIEAPISERILRNQVEFQTIQRAWSYEWPFGEPPLCEVEVSAPARPASPRDPVGRVAAFFSGGVDSFSVVLGNPEITDLVFIQGVDILPWLPHQREVAGMIEERLRAAAGELGLPLHVVETDLRLASDPLLRWEFTSLCAPVAVALFLAPLFDRVLIASDADYEIQEKRAASFLVDRLWSTDNLEIAEGGGRFSRVERTEQIAGNPVVRKALRTCWRNPNGSYNCGTCLKCLRAMAELDVAGDLEAVETFPSEIDLARLGEERIDQQVTLNLFEDLRDAAREAGKVEIEAALSPMIAHGKTILGLPPDYRGRPSARSATTPGAELYATPETAKLLAEADTAVFLVGSYDGSANFGDVAQLDATLTLLSRLDGDILPLPVVELAHFETDAELRAQMQNRFSALYFDPTRTGGDGLVSLGEPAEPPTGISYLYGGGYLNRLWGDRKLAMLRACEALLGGDVAPRRLASGLQVEAEWLEALGPRDRRLLRSLRLAGARDHASAEALLPFSEPGRVVESGDDAVGLLASLADSAEPGEDPFRVTVHFAEHDFATDRRGPLLDLFAETLAVLRELAGGALSVLPVIAYQDPRIDERPGLERLREACETRGFELGEPRRLLPGTVAETAPEIAASSLTLSCSYHVALTSLSLAVPTVLVEDNAYYRQKTAGLRELFDLPPSFAADSETDSAALGHSLAAVILDPARALALRDSLEAASGRLKLQRAEAEAKILGAIGELAAETTGPAVENGAAPADTAEEQLATLLTSRSWRFTSPLREMAALWRRSAQ